MYNNERAMRSDYPGNVIGNIDQLRYDKEEPYPEYAPLRTAPLIDQ